MRNPFRQDSPHWFLRQVAIAFDTPGINEPQWFRKKLRSFRALLVVQLVFTFGLTFIVLAGALLYEALR
jgi:hypothetical protein